MKIVQILKLVSTIFMIAKDALPFVKTTVTDAMKIVEKAKADLEKVKLHQVKKAGVAKDKLAKAEQKMTAAKEAQKVAQAEVQDAVASIRALDQVSKS